MKKLYIGIDPGLSGAIALIDEDGKLFSVFDMPLIAEGRGTRECVHAKDLLDELRPYVDSQAYDLFAVIEDVHSMPKQGVASTWTFAGAFFTARTCLVALGIPYAQVTPSAWKKHHSLIGAPKDAARALAQGLFPDAPLARKKDVGRADALLMAAYARARYFIPSPVAVAAA